ncbi:MAG TPA: hypothetical protein H9819_01995 [Candidatus Bacteroides merdipullorum]|uniref:Uncharacterized protein n=1 Tax=Candidatus Bacteroides merdipullorum TaxID=2838474 RepID=A0A9D2CWL7_9BACE|nr:hypothetical protein [Candidatus Bacteroides merdipullorum]
MKTKRINTPAARPARRWHPVRTPAAATARRSHTHSRTPRTHPRQGGSRGTKKEDAPRGCTPFTNL